MSQIFSNTQIDTKLIPQLEALDFKPISKSYLKLLIFQRMTALTILILVVICVNFIVDEPEIRMAVTGVIVFFILILLIGLVLSVLGFKRRKYAIRYQDIIYAKGLLIHHKTIVPFKRIQHLELHQSFLAKKFDVATLNIFTAGESGGDLKIPGLKSETAERINQFLSSKINGGD